MMRWTRRNLLLSSAAAAAMPLLAPRAHAATLTALSGEAFGTTWRVLVGNAAASARLGREIAAELDRLDAVYSPFRADSELSRLNAGTAPRRVSPALANVVAEALRVARATDGAFDPTVGPAVGRFGFGPIRAAADSAAGFTAITMAGDTVAPGGATIDPCGIAKGHALDRIGALITQSGAAAFFAEFGGEVLVRGNHPAGRPWRVGIEQPVAGSLAPRHVLALRAGALATSGDRTNAYSVGARRYSHVMDPRTGAPVDNSVASVSVYAATAMTADALATALMAMGPARGAAFARRTGLPALFLVRGADGMRDIASPAFRALAAI